MSRKELDARALSQLLKIAQGWYDQMREGEIPYVRLPTRTKLNIEFDEESEVWKYGGKESLRTANTEKSAIHLLKMAYVIGFIKQQIREDRSSTLRELYYITEGWKRATENVFPEPHSPQSHRWCVVGERIARYTSGGEF